MSRKHRRIMAFAFVVLACCFVGNQVSQSAGTGENPCGWPFTTPEPGASSMLDDVLLWADEDFAAGHIEEADHASIYENVFRCMDPALTNEDGVHVCDLENPLPVEELGAIHASADAARQEPDPAAARGLWFTIATDLENFPGGPVEKPKDS